MIRNIVLATLFSSIGLFGQSSGQTWTGFLVNAACYAREEHNTRPLDRDVDHDRDYEVRVCAPSATTKSFSIIDRDGQRLNLDPTGNAKAADLVRGITRKGEIEVSVTGTRKGEVLQLDSIAARQ